MFCNFLILTLKVVIFFQFYTSLSVKNTLYTPEKPELAGPAVLPLFRGKSCVPSKIYSVGSCTLFLCRFKKFLLKSGTV